MLIVRSASRLLRVLPSSSRRSFSSFVVPFPALHSPAMASVEVSPAMAILDKLIDHVSKLNVSSPSTSTTSSASSSSTASSSSSSSTVPTSSYLPAHTVDIAWRPIVPIGHTVYTWVGDEDAPPAPTSTSAAPAPSSATASTPAPCCSPRSCARGETACAC